MATSVVLPMAWAQEQVDNTAVVALPAGIVDADTSNNSSTATVQVEPLADLAVSKDDGADSYVPGSTTSYTIVVTNNGPAAATDVVIADPEPTTPVAATFTGWTCTASGGATCPAASGTGSINQTVPTLPSGGVLTYVVTASIAAGATGDLTNTVTVSAATADNNTADNTATDVDVVASTSSIAKSASPASGTAVAIGDAITYTLTATIANTATTEPIVLTDTIDAGLTVGTLPAECSQAGQVVTCTVPTGTAVGDYVISYDATVNANAGASVGNNVTGGDACPVSCSTSNPVARAVSLDKTWTDAAAGDTVSLAIAGDAAEVIDITAGTSTAPATTTVATANAVGGSTVTVTEAFGTGAAANYDTTLSCTRDLDGVAVTVSGTGPSGSFTMPSDSGVSCTFLNVRSQANLTLIKQWVDALPGDSTTVTSTGFGNNASSGVSTADASGDNATTGTPVVVFAGESGQIVETLANQADYTSTLACTGNTTPLSGNTLTINPADTDIVCTYTNQRISANLTLQKTWVNAAVGETVAISASGSTSGVINLDSTADSANETDASAAPTVVYAGETISLAEAFATPGNEANYSSALACSGTSGLSGDTLTVAPGDSNIVCTFTNTRQSATLQLAKAWDGSSATGDQAQIGATTGLVNNTPAFTTTAPVGDNSGPAVTVFAGEQATLPAETMSGGALANYTVGLTCSGGALAGTDGKASNVLTIEPADVGSNIVCTYTNSRDTTTLTIQKTWLNAIPGDSIAIAADRPAGGLTSLTSIADGSATQTVTGPAQTVFIGDQISMLESFNNGTSNNYDVDISCTNTSGFVVGGGGVGGTLTVGPDDGPITCTWTNDRKSAQLVVQKVWGGPSPGASVDIPATTGFINNAPAFSSTFPTTTSVGPVEVFIEESGSLGGESFSSGSAGDFDTTLTCDGSDTDPSNGLVISAADIGNIITCTYSNTFVIRPELTLDKSTTTTSVTTAGEQIPYTVTAQNTGNVPLNNVTVNDPLLAGNFTCTPAVPVATLAVGASISCSGTYTVTQADIDRNGSGDGTDDGVIHNDATADGTTDDGTPVTDTDSTDVNLPSQTFSASFTKTPTLSDSNGNGTGSVGETINYSFTVTNTGNSSIDTVTITDPLLPGLSCASTAPIPPGATVAFGPVAPPADVVCTGTGYVITQEDIDNQGGGDIDIDNTATMDATGSNGGSASEDATGSQPIDVAQPLINLDKSVSPGTVTTAGEVVTYTFVITNPGNVTLTGVNLTDPLPGLGSITCGADTLPVDMPPGDTVTCTAQLTVSQAQINAGTDIVNTATAAGDYDGDTIDDDDSAAVDVNPGPGSAELVKTADKTFVTGVGEVVTYTFTINNPSSRTLSNLQITNDTLLGAGLSCEPIASLAPGASATFSCTGNTYAVQQGDIDNQGNPTDESTELVNTVTGTAEYDDNGTLVTVTDSDSWSVDLPARAPQMVLTKTSNVGSVNAAGDTIVYSFQIQNLGNVTLNDLQVSDPLLPALVCTPIASLAPGATATFTCTAGNTYTVTQNDIDTGSSDAQPGDGQIDNVATVTAEVPGDGTIAPVSDENEVNLPVRLPAMALEKTADVTQVTAPGTINYTFTVTNNGNVSITDLSLSDPTLGLSCPTVATLQPQASVSFGGAGSGADQICTGTSRVVTQAQVDAGGTLDNTASATGQATDTNGSVTLNATDILQIPINQNPVLGFDKVADVSQVDNPGDPINYTITGVNNGNVTLQNVNVTDSLLATLTCTPAMPIAALAPGDDFECTGTYTATQEDFDTRGGGDGLIENTAQATWTGGNTSDSVDVTVAPQSQSLTIDKTAGTPSVNLGLDATITDAGDTIPYTFLVTNTGNVTLTAIGITDPILDAPATCDKADIPATSPPDSQTTCTGVHTITAAEMNAGTVTNSATAQGTPPGSSRISSDPDTAVVTLDRQPSLQLTKTADPPTTAQGALPSVTDAGDTITYSFSVQNTGNVTLRTITVAETLPLSSGLTCTPNTLEPGQTANCGSASYTLTQADIDNGVVTNNATAQGLDPTDATVTDDDSVETDIAPVSTLILDKTVSPATVTAAGQQVTYSFAVTNGGNVTVSALTINEVSFSGTGGALAITCPATTLAPQASTTCTATYTVTQADIDAGSVTNSANASGQEPDGDGVTSADDDAVVTVTQTSGLTLDKQTTSTSYAAVGDTLDYQYVVTNSGNITITVPITVSDDRIAAVSCPALPAGGLAPNASITCTGSYTVTQADIDAGSVVNIATATDGTTTSNQDTETVTGDQTPGQTLAKAVTGNADEDGSGTVSLDDTLTYTVTMTNTGNTTLDPVTVGDVLLTPNTITCNNVAPGGSCVLTGTYVVQQADVDAGQILNTGTSTSPICAAGDTTEGQCRAPNVTPVPQARALTLDKQTTSTSYAAVGDTLDYQYVVTNSGNVTVTSPITVSDDRIATVSCPALPAGGLAPNASITCTASYTVTQADLDAGSVTNIATASDGTTTSNDDSETIDGTQAPDQTLVKALASNADQDGSGTVSVGDTLTYTVTVTNTGNITLDPVVVSDDRITPATTTCNDLALGASCVLTGTYTVTQDDVNAGQILNTGTSTSPACPPGDSTDGKCSTPNVVPVPQTASLTLDKTATVADTNGDGITGDAGDTITYAFSMQNTGNVVLSPVTVADPLLPSLVCRVQTLAPGQTASCVAVAHTYVITNDDELAGNVTNTATATGDAPGTITDPTADDSEVTPTALTPSSISVAKRSDPASGEQVAPGDTLTFTVTTTIEDAALHEELTLTDTLGDGLTLGTVTAGSYTCNATNPLVCTLPVGTVPGSYDLVYTATVDADATGSVGNSVVPSKDPGTDPDPVCTVCDTDHPVIDSTSVVNKISDPASGNVVYAGETVNFTITTVVSGSITTQDITLTDTLTPGLTFGSVTSAGDYDCTGSLVCVLPAGTLPGSYPLTYTATVDADASGSVGNSVTARNPPGGDPEPVCETCATDHPISKPSVETVKDMTANDDADGNGEVSTGDTLTFTITTTNTGNIPLANVTISDTMITPDTKVCALLAPGEDCVLEGTYTVTQADADAGQVLNTAVVTTETPPDGPPLPPEACPAGSTDERCTPSDIVPVIQRPAIATTKTAVLSVDNATPGKGNVGDVVTYSVDATNTGNVTLHDVTVNDTFQGGSATVLTCAPTSLAPGQTATCDSYDHVITEQEAGSDSGTLVNTVLAQGSSTVASEPVTVNAQAEVAIEVQNEPALLRVTKTAGVREVNIGDLVRYTVTVENVGDIDLVDGYLIDTPALGFTYVDGSLQGDDDDDSVTAVGSSPLRVEHLDIAAGNTATLVYLMRVGAGVRPGVQVNQAQAFDPSFDVPASNVATAEVLLANDPLLDESLISGTTYNDRDGDGWQDSAALTGVKVQGGFAASAYVPGSTTMDAGDGPQPVADASSPLLHGLAVGNISGRQSLADPAQAHQVVIRQRLREPAFSDDFVLTSDQGVSLYMAADGSTRIETRGDAAKGLTAAAPTVERQVAQTADGYVVDYRIRNEGIDERGIPGVRIASVEGLLMETDQYGRYHLVGIDAGDSARGRNFILKVDPVTLPAGAEFTTDNPLVRRITGGVPTRFDFGIRLPEALMDGGTEQVELELGEVLFTPGSAALRQEYLPIVEKVAEQVRGYRGGEVIITATGESEALAFERASAVRTALDGIVEPEIAQALTVSVRTQADDAGTLVAGVAEGGPLLGTLLFETDQATIKPRYNALLDSIAAALEASNGGSIAIIGHADRRASREYNAALGMRRAKAVYEAIAQRLSPELRAKVSVQASDDPAAPVDPVAPQGED
ncbi:DUF7507 domain-containing protein [Pseudoxanthomonas dokdonensis]|uniref:OmpA-like domain-containing protein n=1 Tax=Pseudoxanthomonas dokdonensis TaxID=344882 RepID=A0A0R0D2Y3_9GAMM|nr:isopeptide-forming domain-containing fimbrial protein [Pseudoxanthomonas dokdonensis]KRG71971.1 hypothetical protein ABB29_00435 [Pseudoxanthomonas dokdonensis]